MACSCQIIVDCFDPDRMARFWVLALRYELQGAYWISGDVPDDEVDDRYDSVAPPVV